MRSTRYVVVGGGIVGLATAHRLLLDRPDASVTVLEKEDRWGAHQTGHNSGVIHAGVYYRPGSLKAAMTRAGSASMIAFCRDRGIRFEVCGKLIVATTPDEVAGLNVLHERALANGLDVRLLDADEARQFEPEVTAIRAMRVMETGIVDFGQVCAALADVVRGQGATLRLGVQVRRMSTVGSETIVETSAGPLATDVVVNCGGLHADRVARAAGLSPDVRIIPFRGEYYQLRAEREALVRGLIYPVPNPQLPFLGVHLTRMIDGTVHVGPNAVLALAREGYRWRRVRLLDVFDAASYPGLWRLARRHYRYGFAEVRRSLSKQAFARSAARLVPAIEPGDLVPGGAGVRAQAVDVHGSLVDDFLLIAASGQMHVLNAPSPAATCAFEIAKHIVARLP